jgi:replicative DNA helicase
LEYTHKDVASKIANLDETISQNNPYLTFDFSDAISAEYVIQQTKDQIEEGSLIAIDYLQLLDQQRSKPELQDQIEELKTYAKEKECIIVFISQVDRAFEETDKDRPSLDDERLPNPVDLGLFNKSMFLHNGKKIFNSPVSFEID